MQFFLQPYLAHYFRVVHFCGSSKMEASQRTNCSRWKDARISWQDASLQ